MHLATPHLKTNTPMGTQMVASVSATYIKLGVKITALSVENKELHRYKTEPLVFLTVNTSASTLLHGDLFHSLRYL